MVELTDAGVSPFLGFAIPDQFLVNLQEYASELLLFWAGYISRQDLQDSKFSSVGFPVSSNDTVMKTAIIEVFREIHERRTVTASSLAPSLPLDKPGMHDLQGALEALVWAEGHFPEFARLMSDQGERFNTESAHPDLFLPTYGQMFKEVFDVLEIDADSTEDLNKLVEVKKSILKRFMPTYFDLGFKAPPDQQPTDIARRITDEVEPAFFWFHTRTLDDADYQRVIRAANIVVNSAERQRQNPPSALRFTIDASGDTRDITNPGTESLFDYAPAIRQSIAGIGAVNIDSAAHATRMIDEAIRSKKDDVFSMRRCYPAFKVYFVEPNNLGIGVLDDLYIQLSKIHQASPS